MSLNTRIRERREQLNLSRIDLAQKIGVTPSAIANYENAISSPKTEVLYKLFNALQCDANYLYQDESNFEWYEFKATDTEQEHMKRYRRLDRYGKEHVETILDWETQRVQIMKET